MSPFSKVHTMTDFYDGPRGGVADFEGRPHAYGSLFSESHGYSDTFLLMTIDDELLQLALEDWRIWERWEKAFYDDKVAHETHPALPEERGRHEELKQLIGDRLQPVAAKSHRARAEFRKAADEGLEVRWTIVSQ